MIEIFGYFISWEFLIIISLVFTAMWFVVYGIIDDQLQASDCRYFWKPLQIPLLIFGIVGSPGIIVLGIILFLWDRCSSDYASRH